MPWYFSATLIAQSSVPGPSPVPMATIVCTPLSCARAITWSRSASKRSPSRCAWESTNISGLHPKRKARISDPGKRAQLARNQRTRISAPWFPAAHRPAHSPASASLPRAKPPISFHSIPAPAVFWAPGSQQSPPCVRPESPAHMLPQFPLLPVGPHFPYLLPAAATCLRLSLFLQPLPALHAALLSRSHRCRSCHRPQPLPASPPPESEPPRSA